jgi:hypothetical protein
MIEVFETSSGYRVKCADDPAKFQHDPAKLQRGRRMGKNAEN